MVGFPSHRREFIIPGMAGDGEYVRWINSKEPGKLMFVTTTILGYTPALRNDAQMLGLLCQGLPMGIRR